MSKEYFYEEEDISKDICKFSADISRKLENRIKLYSSKGREESNTKIIFAYTDSLHIIRKIEALYLEKIQEKESLSK